MAHKTGRGRFVIIWHKMGGGRSMVMWHIKWLVVGEVL